MVVTFKIARAADTNGLFGMIETVVPVGKGAPPHVHSREDETFRIIAGTAEFRVGDRRTVCGAGSVIYGPRGVAHGYANVGPDELVVAIVYSPGGVEGIFKEWAREGDPSEISAIATRYGTSPAE